MDRGAAVFLKPGHEGPDPGIGPKAFPFRDRGHPVEELGLGDRNRGRRDGRGGGERGDGVVFDAGEIFGGEIGPVVVGGWGGESGFGGVCRDRLMGRPGRSACPLGVPHLLHRPAMDEKRPVEGFDAREEAGLKADDDEHRLGLLTSRGALCEALATDVPVFGEEARKLELGGGFGEARDIDLLHHPLWKATDAGADVFLEAADHDRIEILDAHLDAARESLRIENLQERGKTVGVAVVGGGRKEQAVLEARSDVADCPRDSAVDGVAVVARRSGVVGLVEDQQRTGAERAEPVTQWTSVGLVDEEPAGNEPAGEGAPGIHRPAPFLADPIHREPVERVEDQAEAGLELPLPLCHHRRRADDDDVLHAPPEEQLAGDQPGFDRLPESDVVGDEEIDPWEKQRFAEGLELIGIEADAGPEGGLEKLRVGGGDTVPAERADERAEVAGVVKPLPADRLPGFAVEDLGVELGFPEDGDLLPLGVILEAGEVDLRAVGGRLDRINEPRAGAAADDLAGGGSAATA